MTAMNDYEQKHNAFLREHGAECTVLLKKDGNFPLENAGRIALFGSGARNTIKGGTGSGEVNSRFFVTVEQGLREAGFTITSDGWMQAYEEEKQKAKERYMKELKAEAKERRQHVLMIAMGCVVPEPEYDLPLEGEGDTAVYVLSRISGEGADRDPEPGDIRLSQTEIRDILACDQKYKNFMLVVNTGGVVDLSPVKDVGNILLLSQLGVMTGHILADILLGKQTPSGKLATTWSAWEDYPSEIEFGEKDDTCYKEGIYVGYRYFDTVGKEPLYPFGYGLSYTEFALRPGEVSLEGDRVSVTADVKNTGKYAGKEVAQLYISLPEGRLDEPYQVLCGFAKTKDLAPDAEERRTISFSMRDIAPYDEASARYILEAGAYVLRIGTSSRDTAICGCIRIEEEITVLQARNVLGASGFSDLRIKDKVVGSPADALPEGCPVLTLPKDAVAVRQVDYARAYETDPVVEKLPDDQLIKMNLGAFNAKGGVASIIGNAGFTVAGAAGQTSMEAAAYGIPSLVMADGPAGLRLSRNYAVDAQGGIHSLEMSMPQSIVDFMSKPLKKIMGWMTYKPKKSDTVKEQFATAIPIGTALAQSFNLALAEECGKMVGFEMEKFGVHLWLAPALNIHRSIRCGRNFEYYSEDPLISGLFAGAVTKGVQSYPHTGTTIKHYAFNNQERNRTQNSSRLSERAAREIYLKGFGICVRTAQPKAVMTSYNLVNGTHTSEHRGLIEDILRAEYGYEGIVMTDWVIAGYENEKDCKHPVAHAYNVCMAGGDLFMPGSLHDYKEMEQALAEGRIDREQLRINATRVMKMAKRLV